MPFQMKFLLMMSACGNMSGLAVLKLIVTLCPRIRCVSDGKWYSEKEEFTRNTAVAIKEVIPDPMRSCLGLPGRNCILNHSSLSYTCLVTPPKVIDLWSGHVAMSCDCGLHGKVILSYMVKFQKVEQAGAPVRVRVHTSQSPSSHDFAPNTLPFGQYAWRSCYVHGSGIPRGCCTCSVSWTAKGSVACKDPTSSVWTWSVAAGSDKHCDLHALLQNTTFV